MEERSGGDGGQGAMPAYTRGCLVCVPSSVDSLEQSGSLFNPIISLMSGRQGRRCLEAWAPDLPTDR